MKYQKYLSKLDNQQKKYAKIPQVNHKVDAVKETVIALSNKQIPVQELPQLSFTQEELFEHPELFEVEDLLLDLRQVVIENFGVWHIFSTRWLADLRDFLGNTKTLELMAGNAIISANLNNTYATDNFLWQGQDIEVPSPWTNVERLDAMQAIQKYYLQVQNIIMAWAPDNNQNDWEVLSWLRKVNWQGNFILIGEKNGATNSELFWEKAKLEEPIKLNKHHKEFDFIKDKVYFVK